MLPEDPLAAALANTRRATRDQVTAVWQTQTDRVRDALSREWREQIGRIVDDQFAEFEAALRPRILEARREVVRSFGRHWHDCFRRMAAATTDREWCEAVLDAAGGLSRHCAFFSVKGESIYFQGARGYDMPLDSIPAVVPIQSAAAFLEVVLSGMPAEARRSAEDLSAPLARVFGDREGRALLVPVATGERVAGVLYLENALEAAAVEAIAMVAGILLSRHMNVSEALRPSSVVKAIAADEPAADTARPAAGSNPLATRAARVAASRILLEHYATVKAGQENGDVYGPLKAEIDEAREQFDYPPAYLDAELVRMLARGNAQWMRR